MMTSAKRSSFFFQAEDGIRGGTVTGVQTCALPIFHHLHLAVQFTHGLITQFEQVRIKVGRVGIGFVCTGHVSPGLDRKSTRLNSSHSSISYAVFCLKKKKNMKQQNNVCQYTAFTYI